jgi:hypothetical protein
MPPATLFATRDRVDRASAVTCMIDEKALGDRVCDHIDKRQCSILAHFSHRCEDASTARRSVRVARRRIAASTLP